MNIPQKLYLILPALLVQISCTAFSGFPEVETTELTSPENITFMISESESKAVDSQQNRNLLMHKKVSLINVAYMEFERSLYQENIALDFATDISTLVLTGATALVGGKRSKENFGAISALIIGSKAAYDQHALMATTMNVLVQKMRADRATALTALERGVGQSIDLYDVNQLALDLAQYYYAGTFPSAINGISKEAIEQENEAIEEQNQIRVFRFQTDNARECLQEYWRPDGNVNDARQELIQAWVPTSNYPNLFFGQLMSTESGAMARVELVLYLIEQGEITNCAL